MLFDLLIHLYTVSKEKIDGIPYMYIWANKKPI